ncbi:MAG: amidase [Xanthobacteraceae bacterium]
MAASSLHELSIEQASAQIAERRLSPAEYLQAFRARAARLEPKLHAFTRPLWDEAEQSARRAEAEIVRSGPRSVLHGIPIGLKDIFDLANHPTTCHSKILLENVAKDDAASTAKLRAAGAVFPGKLATHEFAFGGPAFDLPFPPARNPWDLTRHPGGSSSGSGAAVAANMLPAALGSDTGGSVRHPAFACGGIVGMKPTYGLVSRRGVFPLAFSLDHVGSLTRTVTDNALLLNVLAGHDPLDPASADRPAEDFTRDLEGGLKGLRIGFVRHFHEVDMVASPDVAASLNAAAEVFAREGAIVRDVKLPSAIELAAANRIVLLSEAASVHEHWLRDRPGDYSHMTRQRMIPGLLLSATDYIQAQRRRKQLVDEISAVLREVDVLLVASSLDQPCRIDDEPELTRTHGRQMRAPFNLSGHPALGIMCGLSSDKMPLGLQLVGAPFSESLLYRAARAYERATHWHTLRPPLDELAPA